MPDEKDPNGKNGKSVGLVDRIKTGVKEDLESLKTDFPAKAKEQVELLKQPSKTKVFLHLHPAKINRDSVRYSYTWGMGGITFYLFIVLTLTGGQLMFYYQPSKVQAFCAVLSLELDVPFRKLPRNLQRWAAHVMVLVV